MENWIKIDPKSDFSMDNFPFGVALIENELVVVSRIGDNIIHMSNLYNEGFLNQVGLKENVFNSEYLNDFISLGKKQCAAIRLQLISLFSAETSPFSEDQSSKILKSLNEAQMQMPLNIKDYTDFYSSIDHATNVGIMFRDPENALLPNWKHIPVGYHGRSSSIILSETPIHRPKGQTKPNEDEPPVFGPCKLLDFELEMSFITYPGKELGQSISTAEADEYIFGMCIFNDWSARDIQKWEYVPLGPFLAKNFASSISPWIVMMEALEPFRTQGPKQDPPVLPYLEYKGDKHLDINLSVIIEPENGSENVVSNSNYKYMYWNMNQQLAHHTVNGCNINCGDMYGSGTISGSTPDSYGSMLELSWKGTKPVKLSDGSERKFLQDGDTVIMRAHSEKNGNRVGFGEVKTKILPAL